MINALLKKIKNTGGETYIEALCSFFIVTVTATILPGGYFTYNYIENLNREKVNSYNESKNNIETFFDESFDKTDISEIILKENGNTKHITINYIYEDGLFAFKTE